MGAKQAVFVLMAVTAFLVSAPQARADGGFIPTKAFPKIPAIPGQTALIVHENGVETLIVESTAQTDGADRLAWILPLPAEPTKIRQVSPGALRTLQFCLGPRISATGVPPSILFFLSVFALASGLLAVGIEQRKPELLLHARDLAIAVAILAFLVSISVSSSPKTSAISTTLLQQQRVGNYQVSVIKAAQPLDLTRWIEENGFARLPQPALQAINAYVHNGWVFAVARLEQIHGKLLSPHPLAVTFPAPNPVYPLRLTAIGAGPTRIRLCLAGNTPFRHPDLSPILIDQFTARNYYNLRAADDPPELYALTTDSSIAHPELLSLIPDSAWVTVLEATLRPQQMTDDLVFERGAVGPAPFRRHLFTVRAVIQIGLTVMAVILVVGAPAFAFLFRGHRRKPERYAALLGIALVAGCVVALALPSIPNTTTISGYLEPLRKPKYQMIHILTETTRDHSLTGELRIDRLRERLTAEVKNPFESANIREESSPGNYTLTLDDSGSPLLTLYGENGQPIPIRVPDPRPRR